MIFDKIHAMKTHTVIVGINIGSAAGREILSGVFGYIDKGYSWRPKLVQLESELTSESLATMEAEGVDGYLLSFGDTGEVQKILFRSSRPLVLIGTQREAFYGRAAPTAFVWNDNESIGAAGARHLLSLGVLNSYAFVHSRPQEPSSMARLKGFEKTMHHAGRTMRPSFIPASQWGSASCEEDLSKWLRELPTPAAVMAASDRTAMHVLEAAARCGIKIPSQLMVVSVDNDELLVSHSSPPLSSVQPGHYEMGFKAAAELERLMSAPWRGRIRETVVQPALVAERESTKSVPPAVMLVQRAKRYIRQKLALGISAADVVSYLGCSRELADLRFREIEGKTLCATIEDFRMAEAKRLLQTTVRSVAVISRQCGFKSPSHFCSLFRLRNGMSPSAWREMRR